MTTPDVLKVHGLDLSYFTGKLESYLRAKGLPYERIEMDTADFKRCAKATGVAQMPQVEWVDGQWLSDTTLIIEFLENLHPDSPVLPTHSVPRFIALLLEDFGDEWLWRPALYYRWAKEQDTRLMGHRLAVGMLRDVPLPLFMRRWFITKRQQFHFLWKDGVRPHTAQRIEAHYLETLDAMEQVLNQHPFLLGSRPSLADFALMGSMFRHFFSDPTPAGIMRERAPNVHEWVARMWNTKLSSHAQTAFSSSTPTHLQPLMRIVCGEFLPYMQANEQALCNKNTHFNFQSGATVFRISTQAYRAWRYQRLRGRFQALSTEARNELATHWPQLAQTLSVDIKMPITAKINALPIAANQNKPVGRAW